MTITSHSVCTERTRTDTLDDRQKSRSLSILIVSYSIALLPFSVSCSYILDFDFYFNCAMRKRWIDVVCTFWKKHNYPGSLARIATKMAIQTAGREENCRTYR